MSAKFWCAGSPPRYAICDFGTVFDGGAHCSVHECDHQGWSEKRSRQRADVNPRHSGRGIIQLRNAGITVQEGVLADECTRLNETFNKWILTGLPFVIAKCGMSLDGRLTRPD